MRHAGDSTAGQPAGRPRDPGARDGRGRRGSQPRGSEQAGTGRGGDQSVFVPGYRDGRSAREPGSAGTSAAGASGSWLSPAIDRASQGPARGFPPRPGQPPPLYPPGQFAAWNRMAASADNQAGTDVLAGTAGATDGTGQSYQPGYSALAVSDAAADVTSTQTWQTNGSGAGSASSSGTDHFGPIGSWTDRHGAGGSDTNFAAGGSAGTGPHTAVAPVPQPRAGETLIGDAQTGELAAAGSRMAAPVAAGSPAAAQAGGSGAGQPGRSKPRGGKSGGGRPRGGKNSRGKSGSGKSGGAAARPAHRTPSVVLAVGAVVVLAVAAGAFLFHIARNQSSSASVKPALATTAPAATPTPTATPSLGPYGHIATRSADPLPLTINQLFPHSVTVGPETLARTTSQSGKACAPVLIGSRLQAAVKAGKCTQVVRASYLAAGRKEMGTIGVLNLSSFKTAAHAGHAGGPANFIKQLRARKGPTHQLGKGAGIEEADTKGHYLILIWAQFTSRHKPKTAKQRKELESFMSTLFQQTANVSLSSRMVDGTP